MLRRPFCDRYTYRHAHANCMLCYVIAMYGHCICCVAVYKRHVHAVRLYVLHINLALVAEMSSSLSVGIAAVLLILAVTISRSTASG